MIKAYCGRKVYYIFNKDEVKSPNDALRQTATLAKESKDKFKVAYADLDSDGMYSVELASGKYLCVYKK